MQASIGENTDCWQVWLTSAFRSTRRTRFDHRVVITKQSKDYYQRPSQKTQTIFRITLSWSLPNHNAILHSWCSFGLSCTSILCLICKSLSVIIFKHPAKITNELCIAEHCRKTLHSRTKENGLVSQIQKALWRKVRPLFSRNKKLYASIEVKKNALASEGKSCWPETKTTVNRCVPWPLSVKKVAKITFAHWKCRTFQSII